MIEKKYDSLDFLICFAIFPLIVLVIGLFLNTGLTSIKYVVYGLFIISLCFFFF